MISVNLKSSKFKIMVLVYHALIRLLMFGLLKFSKNPTKPVYQESPNPYYLGKYLSPHPWYLTNSLLVGLVEWLKQ